MRILLPFISILLLISCNESSEPQPIKPKTYKAGFTELSPATTGVTATNKMIENDQLNHFNWGSIYNGAGVSIGDINNDGLPDIYLSMNFGDNFLYLNKGNMKFEDITVSSELKDWVYPEVSSGVSMVDINQDGWLDIYVCTFGFSENPDQRRNKLYINNKNNTFKESASQYGLDDGGFSVQASFFDYDRDGDLDMYLINQPTTLRKYKDEVFNNPEALMSETTTDKLYKNQGNNSFISVGKQAGIDNFDFGLGLLTTDINNDGWTDIYVANDFFGKDNLFINQKNGKFRDESTTYLKHHSNFSMGTDIADINQDGFADIATLDMAGENHYRSKTNMPSMSAEDFWKAIDDGHHYQYMHNVLHLNNGNGSFSEIGHYAGIAKTDWSWSLLMQDFDNDSYNDIFITNGVYRDYRNNDWSEQIKSKIKDGKMTSGLYSVVQAIPKTPINNYMFKNNSDLKFKNVSNDWGMGTKGFSNGAAYADLDLDGDLDLVVSNIDTPVSILQNDGSSNSCRLRLTSSQSKKPTLNSKVKITFGENERTLENIHTRGYLSMSEDVIHFGIGDHEKIDQVEIIWPDGQQTTLNNLSANEIHTIDQDDVKKSKLSKDSIKPMFANSSGDLNFVHKENEFDDFSKQLLLPYKQSAFGPCLASGDINNDGLEDLFIGGASGQPGSTFIQNQSGSFELKQSFIADQTQEDTGAIFFDFDGDDDLDLYVVSGGNEWNSQDKRYQDRLYLNQGVAGFNRSKGILSTFNESGMAICKADVDQDGDMDLFVGGKTVPHQYPKSPNSKLLINEDGKLIDKTDQLAQGLNELGMVTDATFSDYDRDGDQDLIILGEWMPLTIFENVDGSFNRSENQPGLSGLNGLYFHLSSRDIDNDGDQDFVVGNISPNNKFKASKEKPFLLYADDFDDNGKYDIVLANYWNDKIVPVRGRECSSEQLPLLTEKFPSFHEFASASINQIYDLEKAEKFQVENFSSGVFINNSAKFEFKAFPSEAQLAPIFDVSYLDVNNDGLDDLIIGGNFHETEVETTRYDAGVGQVLINKDQGVFEVMHPSLTGLKLDKNLRAMALTTSDEPKLIVANNNDKVQVFTVKLNP